MWRSKIKRLPKAGFYPPVFSDRPAWPASARWYSLCSCSAAVSLKKAVPFSDTPWRFLSKKSIPHPSAVFEKKRFAKTEEKPWKIHGFSALWGLTGLCPHSRYKTIFGWRSLKAPLGSRDNPSQSQWISFSVTFFSSSGVSGQWKESRSRRFIKIQKPEPSHWRILLDVRLRLQKANIQREYGSRWNFSFMMAASPW